MLLNGSGHLWLNIFSFYHISRYPKITLKATPIPSFYFNSLFSNFQMLKIAVPTAYCLYHPGWYRSSKFSLKVNTSLNTHCPSSISFLLFLSVLSQQSFLYLLNSISLHQIIIKPTESSCMYNASLLGLVLWFTFISYTFIRPRLFLYPINSISYSVLHPISSYISKHLLNPHCTKYLAYTEQNVLSNGVLDQKSVTWYDELMQYHCFNPLTVLFTW